MWEGKIVMSNQQWQPQQPSQQQSPYGQQPSGQLPSQQLPPQQQPQWASPQFQQPPDDRQSRQDYHPHQYRGWVLAALVIGYIIVLMLMFIEIAVTSGIRASADTSSSSAGILSSFAALFLLVFHGFIIILDSRSFFTLYGRIQWKRLKAWQRVGLIFAYLSVLVMPAIYLTLAIQYFLRGRQQTLGQALESGWIAYRTRTPRTQLLIGIISGLLLLSFVTFTSVAAIIDRASVLALPTPSTVSHQVVGSSPTVNATAAQPTVAATQAPTPTPTPTPKPTPVPKWTTVQTFKGNGNKKTAVFTVPDDWKIVWSCDPSSFDGGEYNLSVDVYNSDGTDLDLGAINTICKSSNTSDITEEHQGGNVYLDIQSEAAWTIQVQELK